MRLAQFIETNKERILEAWEKFALELASSPDAMDATALRDHAAGMLDVVVEELASPAAPDASSVSRTASDVNGGDSSSAKEHGGDRMKWQFSVRDMVAEFRALRISVIELWSETTPQMNRDDLITFDRAIDRALAESIDEYSTEKERQALLLEGMLSHSSDQSAIFDRECTILYANRALAKAYGKHPHELVGEPVDVFEDAFAAEVRRQVNNVWNSKEECRGDFTVSMSNGEVHVIDFLFAPILDREGKVEAITVNSRDITERRAMERTLWQHANYDHLTGVPNRRLFFDRLGQDILRAKRGRERLAVLYIDLDKFKEANDRIGHDGGDELLQQAARRITACIRETDTLARMGGDEFTVILMDGGEQAHIEGVARAILARLGRPFSIQQESVDINGSIGVAIFPDDGETVDSLVSHADQAMYVAKNRGGDAIHFYSREDRAHRLTVRESERPGGTRH